MVCTRAGMDSTSLSNTRQSFVRTTWSPKKTEEFWQSLIFLHSYLTSILSFFNDIIFTSWHGLHKFVQHMSKLCKNCLKTKEDQGVMAVIDFPPQSPDLNLFAVMTAYTQTGMDSTSLSKTPESFDRATWSPKNAEESWQSWTFLHSHRTTTLFSVMTTCSWACMDSTSFYKTPQSSAKLWGGLVFYLIVRLIVMMTTFWQKQWISEWRKLADVQLKQQFTCTHLFCPLLQPVEATDDAFWDQFWVDSSTTIQDVFALVPAAEIRAVREESPSNLATLCYKVTYTVPMLEAV